MIEQAADNEQFKGAKLIKLFMIIRPLIQLRQTVEKTLRGITNISKPFVTFFIETMEMYLSVNKKINFTQMPASAGHARAVFAMMSGSGTYTKSQRQADAGGPGYMTAMLISIRPT